MHIVYTDFLNDPSRPGRSGTSDTIWAMASHVRRLGHRVTIVAPYTSGQFPDPQIPVVRFRVPHLLYRNPLSQLCLALIGARVVQKLPDVTLVHCRDQTSATALLIRLDQPRLVFTSPGNIYDMLARGNPHSLITTWFFRWFQEYTARRCPALITSSHDLKRWWLRTGAFPAQLAVIPLGVDTEQFRPVAGAAETLGWSPTDFHVLYAGRLSTEKGLPDLITAAHQLAQQGGALKLHLVGDGPMRQRIEAELEMVGLKEHTTLYGWLERERLPLFYSAASVCILPSYSEAFGRVLLESMACGCIFVGSDLGGAHDHIINGVNGFYYPPGAHAHLSRLLTTIAGMTLEARRAIGARASAYINDHLAWPQIAARLVEQVYVPLAAGLSPGAGAAAGCES